MERSIIKLFENQGRCFNEYDVEVVNRIDNLINNKLLGIEISPKGKVWTTKNRFQCNVILTLHKDENHIFVDEKRFVYVRDNDFVFFEKVLKSFLFGEEKKYDKSSFQNDKSDVDGEDESEQTIMRDLEKGEGYKHGLD
jgi:hypothetical protein